jgi:capsular exopolysaccharide synthesis family protein
MIGHRAFTVEDYLALLRRRWWWILLPALVGPIVGYRLAHYVTPVYQSKTLLAIEAPKVSSEFVTPAVPEYLLMERLGDMEEEILNDARLGGLLREFRAEGGTPVGPLRKAIVLTPSYSSLSSGDSKQPAGFYITCRFHSAQAAASVCADVAAIFSEQDLETQEQSASETSDFLSAQLADAKKKLDQQDARLAAFEARYMNALPDQVQTNLNLLNSATIQLEGISESISRAQSDKEYTESLLAQQLTLWKDSQTGLVRADTLAQQIAALESHLTDLEGQYSSTYPDIVDVKNQIAWLKHQEQTQKSANAAKARPEPEEKSLGPAPPMVQQLRDQLHGINEDLRERNIEEQRLKHQIAEYQSRVQLSPAIQEEYSEITRDHQTALEVYNDLLMRLDRSRMAGALEQRQDSRRFSIIEPAALPPMPISPSPILYAMGGFGGGLILGLGVVLLVEFRDKSIRNELDIDSCVQLLTLASLPLVERHKNKLRGAGKRMPPLIAADPPNGAEHASANGNGAVVDVPSSDGPGWAGSLKAGVQGAIPYGTPEINRVIDIQSKRHSWKPDSNAILIFDGLNSADGTEELRTLRTQLELLRRQQRMQSILITSPLPMEGKTFTALNLSLAISCQANRRLLLVDADMRLPQLHRALGAPLTPGLSDYLSGNVDELSIVQRGTQPNLFFIPAGKPTANPSDLISNGRLKLLIRRVAPAFDWIIFDSPPAIPVSDAQLLAEACDGVVVIFRSGFTPFDIAQRACAQFGEKQLLGVVLNRVKSNNPYNYYYRKVYQSERKDEGIRE